MMILNSIALYSWTNGVIMIVIFALVCITLVGILINFMMSGKKEASEEHSDLTDSLNKNNEEK
ncbi:hypothetical protein DFQ11_102522 [Winogradskyella epiphytica]|uniref:Uncharacterized protein n=1 Tax=Winogradskyella epiphytica TaxID=262005 RepID=A0A2V4WY44_9FLAO|nr:hypothetical protein [Winogradskyella epiphytica]PYE81942.1 hypothetical protein DFQ11_102522 [Winogradskyella epiphytica]GGW61649.1 hypothetical protein GCM10008085_11520 [Winogradskyella epiphytica]